MTLSGTYTIVCTGIEAESLEEAQEIAREESHVDGFCGNGGMGDKLIGIYDSDQCDEITIEDDECLQIVENNQ